MALADLISAAGINRPPPIVARRHDGSLGSAARPQKFTCSDHAVYAVKFIQNKHGRGRGAFNEQIVALCGALIEAPVPRVALVEVPRSIAADLDRDRVALNIDFAPEAGIHHGSQWVDEYSRSAGLDHVTENRLRFGALEVLYRWLTCTGDHQWIYSNRQPYEVLSVDHSTFLPGGFDWTQATLAGERTNVAPDPRLATLGLEDAEKRPTLDRLALVSEHDVAAVVARPPDNWGVSFEERVALAEFILARRDALVNALRPPG